MKYYIINYTKIKEYEQEFIEFNDYLPLFLRENIFFEYVKHLRKYGDYDRVIRECVEHRPLTYNQKINELLEWLNEHSEYNDVILEKKI